MTIKFFPNLLGAASGLPRSETASIKRSMTFIPRSTCAIHLPLKNIETFTLCLFSRNSLDFFTRTSKSCWAIFGESFTSFNPPPFCALRASFSFLATSYLSFPTSAMRQTGGFAVEETKTRSKPRSLASFNASGVETTPSCLPSSSISRTSFPRIRSLTMKYLIPFQPPIYIILWIRLGCLSLPGASTEILSVSWPLNHPWSYGGPQPCFLLPPCLLKSACKGPSASGHP